MKGSTILARRNIWLLFVLALVSAPGRVVGRDWIKQKSGTLSWLYGVHFLDAQEGWAVGSQGTVLHTKDGGATWDNLRQATLDTVRDVYFFNRNAGLLLCERDLSQTGAASYLLYTPNGGAAWERVELPDAGRERLLRFVFAGRERGWLIGEAGTFYETADGGITWDKRTVPTRYLLLGGNLLDANTGWLAGAGGSLLATQDGGLSWQSGQFYNAAPRTRLMAVSFANGKRGWAVGADGQIFTTANGGRTWRAQSSGLADDLLDVRFVNAYDGWAIGDKGAMVSTKDGGFHWAVEDTTTTHRLEKLSFTDAAHGWAVGFGGTILAYGTGREQDMTHAPRLHPATE